MAERQNQGDKITPVCSCCTLRWLRKAGVGAPAAVALQRYVLTTLKTAVAAEHAYPAQAVHIHDIGA